MGDDRRVDLAVDLSQRTGRTDAIYRALLDGADRRPDPRGGAAAPTRDAGARTSASRATTRRGRRTSGSSPRGSWRRGSERARSWPTRQRPATRAPRRGGRPACPGRAGAGPRTRRAATRRSRRTTSGWASPTRSSSRSTPGGACSPPSLRVGRPRPRARTPTRPATRRLREAIARYARALARRRRPTPTTCIATNGTQQALDLIARVLVEPGRRRRGRGAGLPARPRRSSRSYGARVVPVPVDDEGLVVDELPDRRPAGLHDAVAPVPARPAAVAGAAAGAARLRRAATVRR